MNTNLNGKHATNSTLRPSRTIVFDWYDGPLGGVVLLGDRRVFQFQHQEGDEFELSPLPVDAFDRILDAVSELGRPVWPMWVPIWKFATDESQALADAAIDGVLAQSTGETIRAIIDFDLTSKQLDTHATA